MSLRTHKLITILELVCFFSCLMTAPLVSTSSNPGSIPTKFKSELLERLAKDEAIIIEKRKSNILGLFRRGRQQNNAFHEDIVFYVELDLADKKITLTSPWKHEPSLVSKTFFVKANETTNDHVVFFGELNDGKYWRIEIDAILPEFKEKSHERQDPDDLLPYVARFTHHYTTSYNLPTRVASKRLEFKKLMIDLSRL